MTPFDAEATCPKCGGEDIAARFAESNREVGCRSYEPCQTGLNFFRMQRKAHIHRYCRRCSYRWLEAPIKRARSGVSG